MQSFHTEQRLNINPTYITSTPIWSGGNFKRSISQVKNNRNLKDNSHDGSLSKKAVSRLRNSVNWLINSAQNKPLWWEREQKFIYFKVNFITLTIPKQNTDDGEIDGKLLSKMLNTFLSYSRKYFYLKNYVWKIERGKLGKLHIHLTTDTFIHWRDLRTCWNRIMQSHGLVDEYFSSHGHYDPNSTDVHATWNIDNLPAYICKYMSKDPSLGKKYKGRLWGCNYGLTEKCVLIVDVNEASDTLKPLMKREIEWKSITTKQDYMGRVKKVGEIYFMTRENWQRVSECTIRNTYNEHRFRIRQATPKLPDLYSVIREVPNESKKIFVNYTEKVKEPPEPVSKNERGKLLTLFD